MARLTPEQVYQYARQAGFPPATARQMVAIAQRESSLDPRVIGTINAAKETSYGLWQINLKDPGIKALMERNGITEANIRDPQTNARAAFLLWGGNDRNLNTAWYIDRTGSQYGYAEKYRDNLNRLPPAELLEGQYSGNVVARNAGGSQGGTNAGSAGAGSDRPDFSIDVWGSGPGEEVDWQNQTPWTQQDEADANRTAIYLVLAFIAAAAAIALSSD